LFFYYKKLFPLGAAKFSLRGNRKTDCSKELKVEGLRCCKKDKELAFETNFNIIAQGGN
jgi:hypothetical protein